ncbi:MAG: CapA family protein [Crocinitomicaceae bacterium]|nr:CapA family protein [Crocinitomicaceae bacterium]MDG1735052.1 CapA family protein [Crocinitomicaceae bacterium]MDG2505811.1 CapA family protein [Crocinitomicaceae bacterium]
MRFLSVSLFLICFSSIAQEHMSLIFVGDIMGHGSQIEAAFESKNNSYDYKNVFERIKPILSKPDFAIANLEVTLAGPPYKGYPQFSSPEALAVACKESGIDVLVTANNHSCDRGGKGIERTIQTLDKLNIAHNGTYKNEKDRRLRNLLILRKDNIRIGLLNYTYGTNGLKAPKPTSVNYIDTNQIKRDIQQSEKEQLDGLIAFVHWGKEYETKPNKYQIRIAQFLFRNGIDIIIGGHPHVIQKTQFDTKKNKLIAYSLGNFVSNQASTNTDGGMLLEIELEKVNGKLIINNAFHHLIWVNKPTRKNKKIFEVLPCSTYPAQESITNPNHISKMKLFIQNARKIMKDNLNVPEENPAQVNG